MGSFASTCAISGLPVEAGDNVVFFMLARNPFAGESDNGLGINSLWWPRSHPLRGKYDDYGGVYKYGYSECQKLWLDSLKIDLIERGWGNNSVHDVPTSKDMSFEELLNALHECRVLISDNVDVMPLDRDSPINAGLGYKPSIVRLAIVREDVWNGVLQVHDEDASRCAREITRSTWKKQNMSLRDPVPFTIGLGTVYEMATRRSWSPEEEKFFVRSAREMQYIEVILARLRYQWRPSNHNGPQFGEWDLHEAYQSMLGNLTSQLAEKRKWEEED